MRYALRQNQGVPSLSSLRPCSGSTPSEVEWSRDASRVSIMTPVDLLHIMQREGYVNNQRARKLGLVLVLAVTVGFWWEAAGPSFAQSEQIVEVTIKDFKFVTKQGVLRLGFPSVIQVRNEDAERHDFGSTMFEGLPTQVEKDGVIVYGRGIGGVFLDPKRDAAIRFNMSRPGKHEFRCSIHPNMKGELLLLSAEAV